MKSMYWIRLRMNLLLRGGGMDKTISTFMVVALAVIVVVGLVWGGIIHTLENTNSTFHSKLENYQVIKK